VARGASHVSAAAVVRPVSRLGQYGNGRRQQQRGGGQGRGRRSPDRHMVS
jgi:hypothetical protein